jgi:4-diphosphocytidyl-2C-methyl-D-erythritol kinase
VITGRGEFVEPLPAIAGGSPALLLVTPGVPVSTPLVFGEYAAGIGAVDLDRARRVSERLAADFRAGLTVTGLMARAQDLAAANDLLPAANSVTPGLEEFGRRLEKLVGRPVCQSGSGPTQWVLYPTLADARKAVRMVRLGIARGTLPTMGEGETFVAATEFAGQLPSPPRDRVRPEDQPHAGNPNQGRAIRPHSVHNTTNAEADPISGLGDKPGQSQGDESR